MKITIETKIAAPIQVVWDAWINPDDIVQWNAASNDWHTTRATVDLRVGGKFSSRMEAKDGSMGFDLAGTYLVVEPFKLIEFALDDARGVRIDFLEGDGVVTVRETFDADDAHTEKQQRDGWQAILDRFARHAESKRAV